MAFFLGNWILITLCILVAAYKNLPFVWFIRFLRALVTRLFITPITHKELSPECLFLPAIHRTRSPLTECDYNIHKSNSTYFTDLDISRGNLSLLLFSQRLSFWPTPTTAVMILSGAQIVFRREIKPYQPYEVWSRVLSWDEKWIYIVSHFVRRGAFSHRKFLLQPNTPGDRARVKAGGDQAPEKQVFASAVSRYVFKQGRKTFSPERMLIQCGLLPSKERMSEEDAATWRAIEERRKRDLEAAQLKIGWNAVHDTFDGDATNVLGRYTDLLWR
ncbi:acyl-CoA thioesterase [Aspergillus alliaceus]|uniref:acyl-CoA thioesterase n=1 Tax=Petromyces alliaceus TaxID=209559 RepID=UPI0012A48481|nr:uncharacterized protein BDW43DRAFT_320843 [Aspergillus alliaceus]KAB8231144.1 hypothetical protein BDW43DRAFT_320843 [Aspergillus alliaceus]